MLIPFQDLPVDAIFVVPNEKTIRLRVKKASKGDAYAYGRAMPADVPALDLQLRENQQDIFSCDGSLMVLQVVFENMPN